MTVVADYTYCISSGSTISPPYDVDFIDISTGSPDGWFWDFGDGESSDVQHPLHTYNEAGPHTCVLTAFETTGLPTTLPQPAVTNRRFRSSTPPSSNPDTEHAQFLATSFTEDTSDFSSRYQLQNAGAGPVYTYYADESSFIYDLSSYPSSVNVASLEAKTNSAVDNIDGVIELVELGKFRVAPTPVNTYVFFADLNAYLGGNTPEFRIQDKDLAILLPNPGSVGDRTGWILDTRVIIQPFDSMDTESKIIFDLANAINFSANPVAGPNTLSSTFTNLSPITHATRSWKRRVNGSGAAFVEFSTAAAPVEIFDKDSP